MKNRGRTIITSILLIPILSIILHGIIPHHHHDDLEHMGHSYCEQSSKHSNDEHDGHQHTCPPHSSDNVESCEACHFTIDAVKKVSGFALTGIANNQTEIRLDQSYTIVSKILYEQVYNDSHFQYYLFRRGPPVFITI